MSDNILTQIKRTDLDDVEISNSELTQRRHKLEEQLQMQISASSTEISDFDAEIADWVITSSLDSTLDDRVVTALPRINLSRAYLLFTNDIFTVEQLSELSPATLTEATVVSETQGACIIEAARNRRQTDDSLAVSVAQRTGASVEAVTETYDALVEYGFTSYEEVHPDRVEMFLINFFETDSITSVYNFDILEPDFIKLLVSEGYTSTLDILHETPDTDAFTPLAELEYYNLFGDRNATISDEFVDVVQRIAECKHKRKELGDSATDTPTLADVVELLDESDIGFSRTVPNHRIATTAVQAALEFGWGDDIIADAIDYFSEAQTNEIVAGGSLERSFAACLRLASVKHTEPTPFATLAAIADENPNEIRRKLNRIVSETSVSDEIDMSDLLIDPLDCLPYIQTSLTTELADGDVDVDSIFGEIETRLQGVEVNQNSPWTDAAAATYAVLSELDDISMTQDQIGEIVSLSTVSIRKNYKKFLQADDATADATPAGD